MTNYNGVIGSRIFVTAQYSDKKFGFRNAGGTSTPTAGLAVPTRGVTRDADGQHFNAPLFRRAPIPRIGTTSSSRAACRTYFLTTGERQRTTSRPAASMISQVLRRRQLAGVDELRLQQSDYLITRRAGLLFDAAGGSFRFSCLASPAFSNWAAHVGATMDVTTLVVLSAGPLERRPIASTFDLGMRFEKARQ